MNRLYALTIVLAAWSFSACSKPAEPAPPADVPPQVQAVAELPADVSAAFDQLQGQLKTRLQAALTEGGPAAAIDVCRSEAPRLTAALSKPELRLGRTSVALRNPENAAPAWARAWLDSHARRKADAGPKLAQAALPGGATGYLRAIPTAPLCVTCHGAADGLAPELRARLAAGYPQDAATGFAAGDLRGWFWAERPAR